MARVIVMNGSEGLTPMACFVNNLSGNHGQASPRRIAHAVASARPRASILR
jgi:hypothetical protein